MSDIDPPPAPSDAPPADARQWGLFAHLSSLVGLVIPLCRRVEKRWQILARSDRSDASLMQTFKGDRLGIWLFAIGFPFAFVLVVKGFAALA